MPTIAAAGLPEDFSPVTIPLPYRTGDVLGYLRGERFVGFYWDRDLGPTWDDGRAEQASRSVWLSFVSVASKLRQAYDVDIGSSETHPSHIFVWDRWRQKGYIASRESALRFLHRRT
jgi:hypothetical protein